MQRLDIVSIGICAIACTSSVALHIPTLQEHVVRVQRCVRDTVVAFRSAFLTQMPANGLTPAAMERLDTDISDLREFFCKHVAPEKVDAALNTLEAVRRFLYLEQAHMKFSIFPCDVLFSRAPALCLFDHRTTSAPHPEGGA